MTLTVHTARLPYYDDSDGVDVSIGTGSVFTPSPALFRQVLSERDTDGISDRTWLQFCADYTTEMRMSYRRFRDQWDALLGREHAVLLCACADATRCHRTVLAMSILTKFGAKYAGEIAK